MTEQFLATGKRLGIRKVTLNDLTSEYLGWLNDPIVQAYTRRRGSVITWSEQEAFLRSTLESTDWHLAIIILSSGKHIGNVSLGAVDMLNLSAELSVMIGQRDEWGKGYASEAIELATEFAFTELGLHRLWAESPNPQFNKLIQVLGWRKEGMRIEGFRQEHTYIDLECWCRINPAG